jgi:hypothetical protein
MSKARKPAKQNAPSRQEVSRAALAWAEFLYDEYMLKKHKQLLLDKRRSTLDSYKEGKQ